MTRDDILAMEAGEDLDWLVVEHIFEWVWIIVGDRWKQRGEKWLVHPDAVRLCTDNERPKNAWGIEILHKPFPLPYSTDIAAAWQVFEKLRKDWPDCDIGNDEDDPKKYSISWGYDGHGWDYITCDTAPEAIAKAALLAVLDKEDA